MPRFDDTLWSVISAQVRLRSDDGDSDESEEQDETMGFELTEEEILKQTGGKKKEDEDEVRSPRQIRSWTSAAPKPFSNDLNTREQGSHHS